MSRDFLFCWEVLLGRFICGFLCPFGWFQELLHKIPTQETLHKKAQAPAISEICRFAGDGIPAAGIPWNDVGMGDPFFCKYLCPQGVLEGAIPLSLANSGIRAALGSLFTWKFGILLAVIVLSVLFYRPFCKWLCPLGAFYALFNKVSLFQMKVDKNKCVSCGKCAKACKMDVDVTKTPNHPRMHPLRDVHPRLSHKRRVLPLRLWQRERKYNKNQYGGIKMKFKKFTALLLAALLVLSLAACGTKDNDKMADMSGDSSAMTGEPKNAEEALALHKKLMEQENTILSQNTALWEKVFMEADKGMAMVEDGKNYGDFLLDTIESAKDQFTDEEYEMLKESATEISNIENKLTELENKYPEIMQESVDGDMSVPAGSDMANPPDDGSMQKFPAFEGKDLDGNPVKSDELFSGNAVTVVNFWFTTCNPCVGELAELDALNIKNSAEKGGALIGVNTFTLDLSERVFRFRRRGRKIHNQHLRLSHHLCGGP